MNETHQRTERNDSFGNLVLRLLRSCAGHKQLVLDEQRVTREGDEPGIEISRRGRRSAERSIRKLPDELQLP
jgi:hypothetical protein